MRYNPALDGIRAVAVLAVMAHHTGVPGAQIGYVGVDVFFVLSGYLITSILAEQVATGGIRLGEFYLRRARRLYPALLGMLALYLAVVPMIVGDPIKHWQDAGVVAFYLSDYAVTFWKRPDLLAHTWSLAVEEHFYLLWPLVIMALSLLKSRRHIVMALCGLFLLSLWWWLRSSGNGWWGSYFRFDTHSFGLVLGAMLAYLPRVRVRVLCGLLIPAVWLTLYTGSEFTNELQVVFATLTAAVVVLICANGGARWLGHPALVYVGRISYALYLYHYPIARLMADAPWPEKTAATFVLSFALAALSYRYVETRTRAPVLAPA